MKTLSIWSDLIRLQVTFNNIDLRRPLFLKAPPPGDWSCPFMLVLLKSIILSKFAMWEPLFQLICSGLVMCFFFGFVATLWCQTRSTVRNNIWTLCWIGQIIVDYLTVQCLIQNPEFDSKNPVRSQTQVIIWFDTDLFIHKQCIL